MKKRLLLFVVMSMFVAASPVLAHDHGSHGSMDHGASQGSADGQNAKEVDTLLNSCAQQVTSIQRRIASLQSAMSGQHAGDSVRDELRKLEQKLTEANDIVRPLQVF